MWCLLRTLLQYERRSGNWRRTFRGRLPPSPRDRIKGEPWFVAKDVAELLGYVNPRKAVSDHCKGATGDGVTIRDAIGREQSMTIIPELDVYRLIMRSKLPAAEACL